MQAKTARRILLGIAFAYGAVGGFLAANDESLPRAAELIVTLLLLIATYVWFHLDATERQYHRTSLLGGAIIFFPMFAIPYYLARSRPQGQKIKAVLRFAGFCLLWLVVVFAAGIPFLFLTREQ